MVSRAQKRKPPERTYELKLDGELHGYRVVMGALSMRHMIQMQREELDEMQILELVVGKVIEHDFDIPDLLDLDYWIIAQVLAKWGEAQKDAALPLVPAKPSLPPSAAGRRAGRKVSNSLE